MLTQNHRLSIALAVSTLAIVSSFPVFAKPHAPVKGTIVSQANDKAAATIDPFAVPVDKVVANAKRNLSNTDRASQLASSATKPKSVTKAASTPSKQPKSSARQVTAERTRQGTSTFTNTDRRTEDFSAVNQLIE